MIKFFYEMYTFFNTFGKVNCKRRIHLHTLNTLRYEISGLADGEQRVALRPIRTKTESKRVVFHARLKKLSDKGRGPIPRYWHWGNLGADRVFSQ